MSTRIFILFILLLFIDVMAFQAVRQVVGNSARSVKTITYIVYWLIPVLSMAYIISAIAGHTDNFPKGIQSVLRAMVFILYFTKLLIAVVILIDDVRRLLFGAINMGFSEAHLSTERSKWMSYGAFLLGAIPFLSLTYGMARNPYRYRLTSTKVPIKDLHPDLHGLKIVQISDIHSGSFLLKEPVERSVQMILEQKPDIVFFTGDLVNNLAKEMEPFLEMFSQVKAPLGVYSILGNHDYGDYHHWDNPEDKRKNFEDLKNMHARLGWKLLLNEHVSIPVKETSFNVIGVENYSASPRFPKHGDLKLATQDMSKDVFNVLLSHDPSHWHAQVTNDHPDIHLTLSGHTHGFQFGVDIPGVFQWSPVQYMYPEWAGLYEKAGQYLYVNRGLGYLGYPGRVGILPEITLITLETA
jgi:predicted MPP superfamily phosphohydrolase